MFSPFSDGELVAELNSLQFPLVKPDGSYIQNIDEGLEDVKSWIAEYDVKINVPGGFDQFLADFDDYLDSFVPPADYTPMGV